MIAPILALATAASIVSAANDQPYVMQKASSLAVNYAVKYRNSDVSEAKASAAAAQIVDNVLAQPKATELVKSAVSYLAVNGATVDGKQALAAATKASSFYNQIATAPGYQSFAALVAEKTPLFDLNRAASDVENKVASAGSQHSNGAGDAIIKANAAFNSLKGDASGAQAIETGKKLAVEVARDFHVDNSKVKAKAVAAKNNVFSNVFSH